MRNCCLTPGLRRLSQTSLRVSHSFFVALLLISRGAAEELPVRSQEHLVNNPADTAASGGPLSPVSVCSAVIRAEQRQENTRHRHCTPPRPRGDAVFRRLMFLCNYGKVHMRVRFRHLLFSNHPHKRVGVLIIGEWRRLLMLVASSDGMVPWSPPASMTCAPWPWH